MKKADTIWMLRNALDQLFEPLPRRPFFIEEAIHSLQQSALRHANTLQQVQKTHRKNAVLTRRDDVRF